MTQKLETPCRNCIFQLFDSSGHTQVGCQMGRLEILKTAGAEILECYDEKDNEFYLIKNRICRYKRDKNWEEKQIETYGIIDFNAYFSEIIRDEIKMRFTAVIIGGKNSEDIKQTYRSLTECSLVPKNVVIINKQENYVKASNLMPFLNSFNDKKIPYRIETILNNELTENECVDLGVKLSPNEYYAVFQAGFNVPQYLFVDLDDKVTNDLFSFGVILPDKNGNGKIVPKSIHKFYNGNYIKNIEDKITEDGAQAMIYTIQQIRKEWPE